MSNGLLKIIVALIALFLPASVRVAAADPGPPSQNVESSIASLPNRFEREWWRSLSKEQRESPEQAELARKIKNIAANCKVLQSKIEKGKSLTDYPGLLSLGAVFMDGDGWLLRVQVPLSRGEGDYGGFVCTFDRSFNVKSVSTTTWVF